MYWMLFFLFVCLLASKAKKKKNYPDHKPHFFDGSFCLFVRKGMQGVRDRKLRYPVPRHRPYSLELSATCNIWIRYRLLYALELFSGCWASKHSALDRITPYTAFLSFIFKMDPHILVLGKLHYNTETMSCKHDTEFTIKNFKIISNVSLRL